MELILKPWGSEEILSHTKQYVMKKMYIKPYHRMSLQYHEVKEETIYVVEGCLLIWESATSTPRKLSPGEVYHVKPNQVHRFGAGDGHGVTLIECSTTELSDVVRLEDDYSRS
jgi:quercetin dioxygenase-like cupin family protein